MTTAAPRLTFELPDPNSARLWTVHVVPRDQSLGYLFIARAGIDERRWMTRANAGIVTRDMDQQPTPEEQSIRQAGLIRHYRQRFRHILASNEQEYTFGTEQTDGEATRDGNSINVVAREVEDLLFHLAKRRQELSGAAANTRLEPLSAQTWEAHEPILRDSDDHMVQAVLPRFIEFHDQFAQLGGMRMDHAVARIQRLNIIGTKALWALDDARSGTRSATPATSAKPWPRERAVHLNSIRLGNLRRFHSNTLHLTPPAKPERGQWILLLGENGTGKTSLLRAIALALLEEDIAQSLVTQFSADAPLIRIDAPPHGQNGVKAEITVHLAEHGQPSAITVSPAQGRERLSVSAAPALRPPVFAYGCRRGNALGGPERESDINPIDNVATLFDPQAHLIHADAWLRKLAYAAEKDETERALFEAVRALLIDQGEKYPLLPEIRDLEVARDRTWVTGPGKQRVPLSSLSDGYLTTLGWLVDFLARWLEYARQNHYDIRPGFHQEMPAVVLVDELDLHLHPRWQTQIVPALASTFPRTTFIATTHNPLTLNGTMADERMHGAVHIIKPGKNGGLELIQRDLPAGMRVDEMLTGDWFDLRSTLDENTRAKLDEHRQLLRAGVDENDPRRRELETVLRRRLGRYADTPRRTAGTGTGGQRVPR